MYRNYIFDLYGTLLDIHTDEDKEELWEQIAQSYKELGALYSPEELRKEYELFCKKEAERIGRIKQTNYPEIEIGKVFAGLAEKKGAVLSKEEAASYAYRFRRLSREYMHPYPGTEILLQKLKSKGKKIYLLSNAQRLFTMPEIQESGLEKYFDDIFISSDYGIKKPDGAYMELLLKKHSLDRKSCIMIGNEPGSDLAAAINAGVDGFHITDGRFEELDKIIR